MTDGRAAWPRTPRYGMAEALPTSPTELPRAGSLQVDVQGQVWLCESVFATPTPHPGERSLVRMLRVHGSEAVGDPLVLDAAQYAHFSRSRRLRTVLI